MPKKGYTPEQIINKLREAEILLSQGDTIAIVSKKLGVSEYTYYRWRKEYGGLRVDQAHRLKELEQENSRLKRLVADISLDNAILKEAASRFARSWWSPKDGLVRYWVKLEPLRGIFHFQHQMSSN